jgi:ornithine cyclodeaminase/alanine dehydrogenase-like protein (mu-crystallin family)
MTPTILAPFSVTGGSAGQPLYLTENDVMALVSPAEVCWIVGDLAWRDDLRPGFAANSQHGPLSLGAKAGFVGTDAFGVKIRAGQEGRYLTVVWGDGGRLRGIVESAYLTYLRTAALMMALPARHGVPVARMLVLGTGRLGSACCLVAQHLYPDGEIWTWSPSGSGPRVIWPGLDAARTRRWPPEAGGLGDFDLVVTATHATEPLPLDGVRARYIGVGGACRPTRRELPREMVTWADQLCSDAPTIAGQTCGDLQGLDARELGPIRSFRETAPVAGTTITLVCGTGAVDAGLALAVCDRAAVRSFDHQPGVHS